MPLRNEGKSTRERRQVDACHKLEGLGIERERLRVGAVHDPDRILGDQNRIGNSGCSRTHLNPIQFIARRWVELDEHGIEALSGPQVAEGRLDNNLSVPETKPSPLIGT